MNKLAIYVSPPPRGGLVEQGVCQSSMGRNP